ncbi:hypothetical protein Leryth_011279 [Lithospermum erythrorhizon]|nr:hypothetical protein Leryth_011279 [Lithospermum erythrorhizon]
MTVDDQQPSVRVMYNSLTRASRKKLEELLQQWSEWHCPSSNDLNEVLESGEQIYFPALNLGVEKASAVPFWIDDRTKNPTNKDFVPLDGNSVPLYDRGFSSALTSVDGPNNLESNLEVLNSSRCFNCGSYSHSLRECPKPRDRVAVDKAKKEHTSKRSHNASSRNPTRYYQSSPRGKFDGLRPGLLNSETRQLLGLGELDPPPWMNRMRELGYPPGYLDSQDGDQPSGITIFADEESKEETKGNILEIGSHEQSRKKSPKPPKKMSVEYPGINAPIPDNAGRMHWKALTSTSDGYYRKCDSSLDSFSKSYDLGTYNARSDYQDDRHPGSHGRLSLQRYGLSSDSFSDGYDFGTYGTNDYQDDRRTGSQFRSCSQRYGISDHLYKPFGDSSAGAIPDHLSSSRYNFSADSINRDYSHVSDIPPGSYLRSTSDRYDIYDYRYTSHNPLGIPSGLRRSSYGRSL